MKDIADKVDAAKEMFAANPNPSDKEVATKLIGPMLDFIGEFVANSRRIANALETIADRLHPGEAATAVSIESKGFDISPEFFAQVENMAYAAGTAFERGKNVA